VATHSLPFEESIIAEHADVSSILNALQSFQEQGLAYRGLCEYAKPALILSTGGTTAVARKIQQMSLRSRRSSKPSKQNLILPTRQRLQMVKIKKLDVSMVVMTYRSPLQ
jgi:hypothetical protein